MTATAASSGQRLWRLEQAEIFRDTVAAAAGQLDVHPLAVEKDYWVCQALRAVAAAYPKQVIFKGGTSLEKLRIIQRFSEDLDLLVVDFPTANGTKTALKKMCQIAAAAVDSDLTEERSGGKKGSFHRRAYVRPPLKEAAPAPAGFADPNLVLIELGESGGRDPWEVAPVTSLLTQQLQAAEVDVTTFDDLRPFEVPILHPGRTLLEKLLRINNFGVNDAARLTEHGWPRIGRQFYDVWALLGEQRVLDFLTDRLQASTTLADCYGISAALFGEGDQPAPAGGFSRCAAFDPARPLAAQLRDYHDEAMEHLYYGAGRGPTFDEVLDRVHAHADLLDVPVQPISA